MLKNTPRVLTNNTAKSFFKAYGENKIMEGVYKTAESGTAYKGARAIPAAILSGMLSEDT